MNITRMVVGVSDWPEEFGEIFDIFPVQDDETDEQAITRGKLSYHDDLEVLIETRIE
jgi:hypothetical protein